MIGLNGGMIDYWSDCSTGGRGEAIVNFGFRIANWGFGECLCEGVAFIHHSLLTIRNSSLENGKLGIADDQAIPSEDQRLMINNAV